MQTITRQLSKEEFTAWDELIISSPQASLFHTTAWNQMLHETSSQRRDWAPLICEREGNLLGGIALHYFFSGSKRKVAAPVIGYNGPVLNAGINYQEPYKTVPGYEIILELLKSIKDPENRIEIKNQPEIWDVRAYAYNGWKVETDYTHILSCPSPQSVWEKLDSALQERISMNHYAIKTDITDMQIQKFSLYASKDSGFLYTPSKADIIKKRIHWMREKGLCRLVTLIDQNGRELAIALFILSTENRTIYMWKTIDLEEKTRNDILSSLIWQSFLSFGIGFERIDLGTSANMIVSNIKDRLGCKLVPIYTAKS